MADLSSAIAREAASRTAQTLTRRQPLGRMIGAFKTVSTKRLNPARNTPGRKVWQRNYHERVVRNDEELTSIREYIVNNPVRWELDKYNPEARSKPTRPNSRGARRTGSVGRAIADFSDFARSRFSEGGSRTAPTGPNPSSRTVPTDLRDSCPPQPNV